MKQSKRGLWLALLIAACAGTGPSEDGASGNGVTVPLSWQSAREVNGHQVHVLEQRISCVSCHQFTQSDVGIVAPASCSPCHRQESTIRHAEERAEERFGEKATADCTHCHAFSLTGASGVGDAGEPQAIRPDECRRCHDAEQGETPAVRVHGSSECVECHRPHLDDTPKPGPCEACHAEISTSHAAEGQTVVEGCTRCHEHQHAPASHALSTCGPCHATEKPIVADTALFPEGHRECVGCHRPHEFDAASAVECRSCHSAVRVLGTPKIREHARCASCHDPHDVRGSPEKACAKCHTNVHPTHPTKGVAGTCVGCHDPHPAGARADAPVRDCTACHQTAGSDVAHHAGVACTGCHQPHDFVLSSSTRDPCRRCHERSVTLTATLAGHAACEGCHRGLPHRPERLRAGCETCHRGVKNAAHAGHRDCQSCHEPHGGAVHTECRSCHAAVHRTAPKGHQNCTACHEQHSGSVDAHPCASCHRESAKTPHGARVAACTTCHRPHGPGGTAKPPPCASCHAPASLFGLHRTPRHDDCLECHTGHGQMVEALKATCLSCHRDKVRHFPDAPSCASCHLFEKTR